ncbi:peptidylprolyl isomerase [Arenivirga flava]|uniref:peptidylprolyl isomerase n=1 Tax=Arenivirga flava TaxID=1930060 RepID=A0AA37UIS0_9MICO|nr:peptidylprolyl isomerase [Arenivirga flava]GMA27620.1 hypothetical protein GCM10025874_08730 [Arenivirga flava]
MAASRNQDREARDRLRRYAARQEVHRRQGRRRLRDNVWAVAGVIVVAGLATATQISYFSVGPGVPEPTPSASASPEAAAEAGQNVGDVPSADLAEDRTWTGSIALSGIDLGIEFDGAAAPQGVSSFVTLAQSGFYDGLTCHRLTTGESFKVLQCGDPNGDGTGGPDYSYGPIENAPSDDVYPAGTIAMARVGGDAYSMGSQFFIVYGDTTIPSDAAGGYTVLGTVTSGLDQVASQIAAAGTADGGEDGAPAAEAVIEGVTVE